MRRALSILAVVLSCACLPAVARAAQSVRLSATLAPNRLGERTTLGFGIRILAPAGRVPSPVIGIDLSYPNEFGIGLSGLGLEACRPETLEALGPRACPPNSRMGFGTALVEIPIGPVILRERAALAIVRAPVSGGRFALMLYAEGASPVEAQIALPALLLPAAEPFGGRVKIHLPLVPSVPEAPDVALVQFSATLGPEHLVYYERVNGRSLAYHPKGILLPKRCPRGGFPFLATFAFLDGTHAKARTVVPCPGR